MIARPAGGCLGSARVLDTSHEPHAMLTCTRTSTSASTSLVSTALNASIEYRKHSRLVDMMRVHEHTFVALWSCDGMATTVVRSVSTDELSMQLSMDTSKRLR